MGNRWRNTLLEEVNTDGSHKVFHFAKWYGTSDTRPVLTLCQQMVAAFKPALNDSSFGDSPCTECRAAL